MGSQVRIVLFLIGLFLFKSTPFVFADAGSISEIRTALEEIAPRLPVLSANDIPFRGTHGLFAQNLADTLWYQMIDGDAGAYLNPRLETLRLAGIEIFYGIHVGNEYPSSRPRICFKGSRETALSLLRDLIGGPGVFNFLHSTQFASLEFEFGKTHVEISAIHLISEFYRSSDSTQRPGGDYTAVLGVPFNDYTASNGRNYYSANSDERAFLADVSAALMAAQGCEGDL